MTKIKVIKVPSDRPKMDFYTPHFEPMPILYMELLENKQKVKLGAPKYHMPKNFSASKIPSLESVQQTAKDEISRENNFKFSDSEGGNSQKSPPPILSSKDKKGGDMKPLKIIDITNASSNDLVKLDKMKKETPPTSRERRKFEIDNDNDFIGYSGSLKTKERRDDRRDERKDDRKKNDDRDRDDDRRDERRNRDDRRERDRGDDRREERSRERDRDDDRREERSRERDRYDRDEERSRERDREDLKDEKKEKSSDGLSKLLRGEEEQRQTISIQPETITVAATIGAVGVGLTQQSQQVHSGPRLPPTLEEIQTGRAQMDSNGIRDMSNVTREEEEETHKKRELLFNLDMLRKRYTKVKIPEFSEHTDVRTLQREYDMVHRQLVIDDRVANYKRILTWGMFGLEWILTKYVEFPDIAGFAIEQFFKINEYESLLLELGQKSYFTDQTQWPVEIRLLLMIMSNAAVFAIPKIVKRKTGDSAIGEAITSINSMFSQTQPPPQYGQQSQPQQEQKKKTRITPPEFEFEDISMKKTN